MPRLNLTNITPPSGTGVQELMNDDGSLKTGPARYSLDQVRSLRQKSAEIEKAALLRFQLEREHQQQLSAAQAIQKLSALKVSSPDYGVERAKILSDHTDANGSQLFQKVLGATNQDYENFQNQQKSYNQELFQSTTAKRLSKVADSPLVPAALKSKLLNDPVNPTAVNLPALEQAEGFLQAGKANAAAAKEAGAFYQNLQKTHNLTSADLNSVNMTGQGPGAVKYIDNLGGKASSEDVRGNESAYKAQFPLANGDLMTLPLDKFQGIMRSHDRFQTPVANPTETPPADNWVPFRSTPAAPLNAEGFSTTAEGTPGQNAIRSQVGLPAVTATSPTPAKGQPVDLKAEVAKYLGTPQAAPGTPAVTPAQAAGTPAVAAAPAPTEEDDAAE